jgi:cytochrome c oxidase subunit 2
MEKTALETFGSQSALQPGGRGAEVAMDLTVLLHISAVVIFALMIALFWFAWRSDRGPARWWIWSGGVAFPLVALTALTILSALSLNTLTRLERETTAETMVVDVTGYQFWWDIVYEPRGAAIRDANELYLPVGVPVRLRLRAADVIHSFWVPSIAGKLDMIPGRVNELTVMATKPGRYRGQCAEFCGVQHPRMAFEVVVLPEAEFRDWLAATKGEARDAARPELLRGRDLFVDTGCPACHEIRGVVTGGRLGPDLTRVGGRGALGAGMWRMNVGNLAGWIADVQGMKPGARMPSFDVLSGPDLRAIAAYLASLK